MATFDEFRRTLEYVDTNFDKVFPPDTSTRYWEYICQREVRSATYKALRGKVLDYLLYAHAASSASVYMFSAAFFGLYGSGELLWTIHLLLGTYFGLIGGYALTRWIDLSEKFKPIKRKFIGRGWLW